MPTRQVLDLFCGAGGASLGLASLGFAPLGFELDTDAAASHEAAGHRTIIADLATLDWAPWRGRVDFMHGSPPCQPFSAAGKSEGEADKRDGMPWMLRAVAEVRPRIVTIENVPGLASKRHAAYLERFLADLGALGYDIDHRVLNAADYGVPQTRKRLIIIARRDGVAPKWPDPTHAKDGADGLAPWVTMAEALGWGMTERPFGTVAGCNTSGGFDPWGLGGSGARRTIVNERDEGRWTMRTNQNTGEVGNPYERSVDEPAPTVTSRGDMWKLNTGRDWKKGGTRDDAQTLEVDQPAPAVSTIPGQWVWQRPATTVMGETRVFQPGGHHQPGEQSQNPVRVELAELAVLQGFSADYPFVGNRTSRARQIGNALPPAVMAAVAYANLSDTPTVRRHVRAHEVLAMAPRDNAELFADCARLGYLDGVVADVTYGEGRFWRIHRPAELLCFDLDPAYGVTVADARHLPLADDSVDVVVFDPPYKLNGTSTGAGAATLDASYGVAGPYVNAAGRHDLLLEGTTEALRVARRHVLVKCQDQISSGRFNAQTFMVWAHAEALGARMVDLLHVQGGRAQPMGRRQVHARRNYSSLLVLEVK